MKTSGPKNRSIETHKPTIQVAAAVIQAQGRFLITRRRSDVDLPGYWEFPGGKREEGELLEDCVQREVQEELGVEVALPVWLRSWWYEYPDKVVELHFFRCVIIQGEPRPLGCADWRWVFPADLTTYQFPPADERMIAELQGRQL